MTRRTRIDVVKAFIVLAGGLVALGAPGPGTTPAQAQGRPDSLRMSCAQVTSLVRSRGAVVIGTGPHIYDRYVSDRRFCSPAELAAPEWIRTRDGACMLYLCKPASDFLWWD